MMSNKSGLDEVTLKLLLRHFRLSSCYSPQDLNKEITRYGCFQKKAQNNRLTDEAKISAFRSETVGRKKNSRAVNFATAAAWGYFMDTGKKTLKDLIPEKKRLTPLDCVRVQEEGVREDDSPELKQYFALYDEYQKERDRWDMSIPDKIFKKLQKLSDSESDKYLDELTNLIESWMKNQPPETLSELLQPNTERMESLRRMARPYTKGGLKIPFPAKYPFGVHFLTVNILAKLYGTSPEIMDAILTRISEIYRGAKKRQPTGRGAEILAGQVEECQKVIEHISSASAKEIENLEWYINTSLANWFRREKGRTRESKEEIAFTDLTSREGPETEGAELDRIISETISFQELSRYPDKNILTNERAKELGDLNLTFRKKFRSLPDRQRDLALLLYLGDLTQEKIAQRLGCNVRTIKRDLKELRSNPDLQGLFKKDKDLRSE